MCDIWKEKHPLDLIDVLFDGLITNPDFLLIQALFKICSHLVLPEDKWYTSSNLKYGTRSLYNFPTDILNYLDVLMYYLTPHVKRAYYVSLWLSAFFLSLCTVLFFFCNGVFVCVQEKVLLFI